MTIESQSDIDGILNAGRVVARVRDAMLHAVEAGMTTAELCEQCDKDLPPDDTQARICSRKNGSWKNAIPGRNYDDI